MADIPVNSEYSQTEVLTKFENINNRPFKAEPSRSKVVIAAGNLLRDNLEIDKSLRKGGLHGRNTTLRIDEEGKMRAFWIDNLPADVYGDVTYKGTTMSPEPYLEPYSYSVLGVHTRGLMEQDYVERIVMASKVLREHGLPTEFPRQVKILKEIWISPEKKVTVAEWKNRQLEKIDDELKSSKIDPKRLKYLNNAREYLEKTNYVVLERDVQSDTRLEDIYDSPKEDALKKTMEPIFKWLNTLMRYKKAGLIPGTPRCEDFSTNNSDLIRYFSDYYPSQAGIYVGKLRALRLSNGYLHIGNWQGVPTILDLDSMSGKLISPNDTNPTNDDYSKDFLYSVTNISTLIGRFKDFKSLGEVDYQQLEKKAIYVFLENYLMYAFDNKPTQNDTKGLLDHAYKDETIFAPPLVKEVLWSIEKKLPKDIKNYRYQDFFRKIFPKRS